MCGDFSGTQTRMAERMRAGRLAFLKNLKQTVSGQQREMRADIVAARRAWAGRAHSSPAISKPSGVAIEALPVGACVVLDR